MMSQFFPKNPILQLIFKEVVALCEQHRIDETHGWQHALKIAKDTEKALNEESINEELKQDVMIAALLHDIDDRKYFNSNDFQNAKNIIEKLSIGMNRISRIITMIDLVSFSKNGNNFNKDYPIVYYFPRYVDRAEAIGVQGLYRSYEYNKHMKNSPPLFLQSSPRPESKEQLMQFANGRQLKYMQTGKSDSVIDHIFDKLVHIRLPQEIKNKYLQELYQQRQTQMIQFVLRHSPKDYQQYEVDLLQFNQSNSFDLQ